LLVEIQSKLETHRIVQAGLIAPYFMKDRMIEVKIHTPRLPILAYKEVVGQAVDVVLNKGRREIKQARAHNEDCRCHHCFMQMVNLHRFYQL